MRKQVRLIVSGIAFLVAAAACDKKVECYTCTDCQGQYGNHLNGEKCSDGFDNKSDWKAHKEKMEEEGCICE